MRLGLYAIIFLAFLYAGISILIILSDSRSIELPDIDLISVISLVTFISLLVVGMINERYYLTILIFMIVAFPTAVNNFIPGVQLGDWQEVGASIFPFITHLDVYLFAGILRFSGNSIDSAYWKVLPIVLAVALLMILSFVINALDSRDIYEAQLLVAGSFQFRYLILIFFVLLVLKEKNINSIAIGLAASVYFLLVESLVFTLLRGEPRLASGSLATNTFGNIVAQIGLFLFFFSWQFKRMSIYRLFFFSVTLTGLLIAFFTETRMSIIAALAVCLIVWSYRKITGIHFLKIAGLALVFVLAIFQFNLHEKLPLKYRIWETLGPNEIAAIMSEEGAYITSVPRTLESSSIITRLQLFRTSFRMIEKNPLWGIGAGRWNYMKANFGFDLSILLDAHNGYLALLSQFGILSGIGLILFLMIMPSMLFLNRMRRIRSLSTSGPWLLGVISLGMSICELSNAGVFKPQVFALLTFISMMLLSKRGEVATDSQ